MTDRPSFRFYPGVYEHRGFEESSDPCAACGRPCVWKYTGGLYSLPPKPAALCARCIADGSVSKAVQDGRYGFHDMDFDAEVSEACREEVERRTPGFATYNPFVWPVRDGMPLAFLGFGHTKDLETREEVLAAMAALAQEMGAENIDPGYAMIFRTLDGARYVTVLDLD